MTKKQRRKWHEAQTKKQIEEIKRAYPPAKVRAVLDEGLPDEEAAAKLSLNKTDFKILVTMYTLSGEI